MVDVQVRVDDEVDILRTDTRLSERSVETRSWEPGAPSRSQAGVHQDRLPGRTDEKTGDAQWHEAAVVGEVGRFCQPRGRVLGHKQVRVHEHGRVLQWQDLNCPNACRVHGSPSRCAILRAAAQTRGQG